MKLPILETPTFNGKISSSGKSFEFRPFLVKEQKILLFALETGDIKHIYMAFRDIIQACISERSMKNIGEIDDLPSFDAESIFLQISSKSVGEKSRIKIKCTSCGKYSSSEVILSDTVLKQYNPKANIIMITDSIGLKMKYPTLKDAVGLAEKNENMQKNSTPAGELIYDTIIASIESIFDENNVYSISDYSRNEIMDFLNSLSIGQMKKIESFFESSPYLAIEHSFVCEHCKTKNKQEIRGIKNFF